MEKESIEKIVELRMQLIEEYRKRRDYLSNKNAIMREIEHVEILNETIKKLDSLLAGHVTFS